MWWSAIDQLFRETERPHPESLDQHGAGVGRVQGERKLRRDRYTPPFDRHDWLIDRCGTQVRYVIDFYTGKADTERKSNMAFYLDVRPALDDWEGVRTRVMGLWNQWR